MISSGGTVSDLSDLFERWDLELPPTPVLAGRAGHRCFECVHPDGVFDLRHADPAQFLRSCSLPMPLQSYAARSVAATLVEVEAALTGPVSDLLWVNPWCDREPFDRTRSGRPLTQVVEERVRAALRARRDELEDHVALTYPTTPRSGPEVYLLVREYSSSWHDGRLFDLLYRALAHYPGLCDGLGADLYVVPASVLDAARTHEEGDDLVPGGPDLVFYELDAVLDSVPFQDEAGKDDCDQVVSLVSALAPELGLARAVEAARSLTALAGTAPRPLP